MDAASSSLLHLSLFLYSFLLSLSLFSRDQRMKLFTRPFLEGSEDKTLGEPEDKIIKRKIEKERNESHNHHAPF